MSVPQTVLRPNSTVSNVGWTVSGGASAHAALKGLYYPVLPTDAGDVSSIAASSDLFAGTANLNLDDAPADFATSNSVTLRVAAEVFADAAGPGGTFTVTASLVVNSITVASVTFDTSGGGDINQEWRTSGPIAGSWTSANISGARIVVTGSGDASAVNVYAVEAMLDYAATSARRKRPMVLLSRQAASRIFRPRGVRMT